MRCWRTPSVPAVCGTPASHIQQGQLVDAATTVFTIDADDVDKSVAVDGLGEAQPDGEDAAAYQGFLALGVLLADFGQQVAQGQAQDPAPVPAARRTARSCRRPWTRPATSIAWPWPDLTLDDFQPLAAADDVLVGTLTPAQAALVTTVPSGGVPSIAIQSPDGAAGRPLSLRPLLPEESSDIGSPRPSDRVALTPSVTRRYA